MDATRPVEALSLEEAAEELAELARRLAEADVAYHQQDAPRISDADYDALKRRNAAIEARYPELKRADSPSGTVGAAPAEGFAKVRHAVPMLSLANAFAEDEIAGIRRAGAPLPRTCGPRSRSPSPPSRRSTGSRSRCATRAAG